MKISIACPEAVRQNQSVLQALNGATVEVSAGLLSFDFDGDPSDAIREWDEALGLAIADSNDAVEIQALGQLKAAIADVRRHHQRESSYIQTRRSEVAEATTDTAESHSHAESNTSTDDSSEQHGAVSEIEENVNEAPEEGQDADEQSAGQRGGRRKRG